MSVIDPSKKVAIVGFASSSRDLAPYANPEVEIWSMNHAYTFLPRWDRWFEMHPREHFTKDLMRNGMPQSGATHAEWLKAQPAPKPDGRGSIYMQEAHPDIPASVTFPRERINAWMAEYAGHVDGLFARDYYTSTISQMMALAMIEGFGEIGIFGVDLLQDEEYFYQRAGAEYLIGLARGMGIKVFVPQQSALCKANYTYGYSEPPSGEAKLKPLVDFFDAKATQAEGLLTRAQADANVSDGAVQAFTLLEEWLRGPDCTLAAILEQAKKKREELQKRRQNAIEGAHQVKGQAEAFKTSGVWIKHFARGGALET